MDDLDKLILENMKDPKFRRLWFEQAETHAIAHNVFKKRDQLNMTEEELAKKVNLPATAIGDIEFGEYEITEELLQQLAEVLNTTVPDLKKRDPRRL